MSDGRTITVSLLWTTFILVMARGWVGTVGEWIAARVRIDAPQGAAPSTPGALGESGFTPSAGAGTGAGGGGGGSW